MEANVIPLTTQIKALHPETGKPVTIVGVDATRMQPRLIILVQDPTGIYAEVVDCADHARQ